MTYVLLKSSFLSFFFLQITFLMLYSTYLKNLIILFKFKHRWRYKSINFNYLNYIIVK